MSPKVDGPQKAGRATGTIRVMCGCASAYQDARYGPGIRVHNLRKASGSRCGVCGREKDIPK